MEFVSKMETLSLDQILEEIGNIMKQVQSDLPYDSNRLEQLIKMQEDNPDFQAQIVEEYENWRDEINDYCAECLDIMRSFVPPNIFSCTFESLLEQNLPEEIARRVLYKPCLWLTRMTIEEISRLHVADLTSRYDVLSQNLDITETAAIYYSLPDRFHNDSTGKKIEWRESIERSLRHMIEDKDADSLPKHKMRAAAYTGLKRGPIMDLTTVKNFQVVSGETARGPRKSFQEVCSRHSLIARMKAGNQPADADAGVEDEAEDEAAAIAALEDEF